jgi:hypothetical protein
LLLQQAWRGEWYGVRVYGELADARPRADQAAALLELVVLETYVLGELTVALFGLGVEPELGDIEAEATADTAAHLLDEWVDLAAWIKADAETALGLYRPLLDLVGDDATLADVASVVVDHERALVSFADRTLRGESGALDDVRALVRAE